MSKTKPVKIDREQLGDRTVSMMADFLHRDPVSIDLKENMRKDWNMTDRDFEILETWIEGPIDGFPGFFQDVEADVTRKELLDPELKTGEQLAKLIWNRIPKEHKKSMP